MQLQRSQNSPKYRRPKIAYVFKTDPKFKFMILKILDNFQFWAKIIMISNLWATVFWTRISYLHFDFSNSINSNHKSYRIYWREKNLLQSFQFLFFNLFFSSLLKRSPVVALFLWVLLVSSTVLSLSEAKNPTKLQMTNSLNFQPPLKNLVKSQHHQLLQLQQDQNNIIYNKDDTNQLLNQVSVSASSTRKTEISTRKNQHQRNHQNSKYSNHNRNRNRSNRNRKSKQHNTNQLRSQTKMDCTVNPDPIWIRNDCTDGFLAIISDRRVVTLNSRVDQHDNLGKIFKIMFQ